MKLINPILIMRVLSTILLIITVCFILCIPVALYYNEPISPFLLSTVVTGLIYLIFPVFSWDETLYRPTNREGYLAVTLAWIILSLTGSLPYLLSKTIPSFINAFFESASGFTTTGSSILENVEELPHSILFWRSLTHWVGGLGIIVLVIIILPSLRITGYHLFSLESSLKEKIKPKTKEVVIRILYIYTGLTVTETVLLTMGDMDLFDSICHSFGTMATGGFSTKNDSLMSFSSYSQYIVMIFMALAGTSQVIFYYLVKSRFNKIKENEELRFYTGLLLFTGILASIILLLNSSKTVETAFREGFFQIVSIITCTGFASADYLLWPSAIILLVFLLMFSGGSTGSTSGGIKIARHLIVLKNIRNVLFRLNHPKSVSLIKLNGKKIAEKTSISILTFIVLYVFLFITWTGIILIDGVDLMTSASSVASCMAGIGPGLGSVGPMCNYASMPELSKIVLIMLMIIGRLEIITVFIIFSKTFWKL
jgi:trk system potassium uptake protein